MKNTLIWTSDFEKIGEFGLQKNASLFHILESDVNNTEFKKVSKEMKKKDCDRILKIYNNYEFEIIYKKNSVWSSIKFNDLITNWMIYKKISPVKSEQKIPEVLNSGKQATKIKFPFEIHKENIDDYNEVIKFYLEDGSLSKILGLNNESYSTINTKIKLKERDGFDKFAILLTKSKPKGINFSSATLVDENNIEVNTKFGKVYLNINSDNNVFIYSVLSAEQRDIAELFAFAKATNSNMSNYITNTVSAQQSFSSKMTKKNIATWILSFTILIVLFIATFMFVLQPKNTGLAIKIMFSKYSWAHQWIYLLWMNFIISLFIIPIVSVIFIKATEPNKKIKPQQHINLFISAQVRLVVVFLTGNAILATLIWGWYLNSTRGVKVVRFVGLVVSVNIIRGVILLPIGAAFMIRGTIFNHTIFGEMGLLGDYYTFVALSWIGWIWHAFENLAITLLIVMPPLHILYNKMMFIRYRNEKNSNVLIDKFTTFEMNLVHLKTTFKDIFKDYSRLSRMSITMVVVILLETFEFTFSLRLVEDYANYTTGFSTANYWNVFAISGVRYMSGFVRHVPIINLIPGQGMGITEIILSNYTYGIINHAHGNGALSINQVTDLSEQTTFIIRFFNFYLKRFIALIICMIIIPRALINRRRNINKGMA